MKKAKPVMPKKPKELDELQEIARVATREELKNYEPISEAWEKNLTLGTFFDGDNRIFELYVAAERPADAIMISSARVNRKTRVATVEIKNLERKSVS